MSELRDKVETILHSTSATCTQAALAAAEPQLRALGVMLQRNSSGEIRGRLYLPDIGGARVVDVVRPDGWGAPWVWLDRGLDPSIVLPAPPGVPPTPPPTPPSPDWAPVLAALARLTATVEQVIVTVSQEAAETRRVLQQSLPRKLRW